MDGKIINYSEPSEFVDAMGQYRPNRVFTSSIVSGAGSATICNWGASFSVNTGVVHDKILRNSIMFGSGEVINKDYLQDKKIILDGAKLLDIEDIHGRIEVSEKYGDVYHMFEASQETYDSWLKLVKTELPRESAMLQYEMGNDEGSAVIDATEGIMHYVLNLDGREERTLENTLRQLSEFATRNNGPTRDWFEQVSK